MRSTFRIPASLIAFCALVGASSVSCAQPMGDHPAAPAGSMHEHGMHAHMREHMEAKARALHDILNLRPDQESAFQTFVASMKPPEDRDEERKPHDEAKTPLTTPERLDRMTAHMAERQAAFQHHADAVKQFYAVLSPEQRRAFDALSGMMMGGRHGPHGPEADEGRSR